MEMKEGLAVFLLVFLVVSTAYDMKVRAIPTMWFLLFGVLGLILQFVFLGAGFGEILLVCTPGAALLLLAFCTKESIGYGDGLAVVLLGIFTGFMECLLVVCAAFLLTGIFSLGAIVWKRVKRSYKIPFLPFLTISWEVIRLAFF